MAELEDAVKFLEQFGGSDDPPYVSDSSVFGKGDRVTDQYGNPIGSLADKPAADGALGQVGGARLSRKTRKTRNRKTRNRKTRNRKTRNRKTRNRKTHRNGRRPRFTLNLRAQIRLKH